jgi:hypothetical protein
MTEYNNKNFMAAVKEGKKDFSRLDLSGEQLFDINLEGAELVGANLSNCDLSHCNLKGADLTKAILTNSRLWNSDLTCANLTEAELSGTDLWNTCLYKVKIWHTNFKDAKSLSARNFSRGAELMAGAGIDETGLLSAEEAYRDLKNYFLHNGMYNDASWASFKEKTIERLSLKRNGTWRYFPSLVMNLLCGYGEKPHRIALSSLFTILIFAFIQYFFRGIENSLDPSYILKWSDCLYYSTITFTTVGYGDFIPKASSLFRLLAAAEAFLGVFLTGLFIFTLARRYSAR